MFAWTQLDFFLNCLLGELIFFHPVVIEISSVLTFKVVYSYKDRDALFNVVFETDNISSVEL